MLSFPPAVRIWLSLAPADLRKGFDALAELVRVLRVGGSLLASTWGAGPPDPLKAAGESVLQSHGWQSPDWFVTMTTGRPVSRRVLACSPPDAS